MAKDERVNLLSFTGSCEVGYRIWVIIVGVRHDINVIIFCYQVSSEIEIEN